MRKTGLSLIVFVAAIAQAQTPAAAKLPESGLVAGMLAPADKAVDFPLAQLLAADKDMDAAQRQSLRIIEGGKYNINIRRLKEGERSLVHPSITDVWVVTEGSGILVTGGELVNATKDARGEQTGTAIRGGTERMIKTGDVIVIPPGVAHAVKETKQITYLNIRFDVK